MSDAASTRAVEVVRVRGADRIPAGDQVAVEEPLEVRLHGRPFAVVMRTPGADRALAAGFLFAERVIRSLEDLGTIEHCSGPADPQLEPEEQRSRFLQRRDNIVNVTLTDPSSLDALLAARRNVATTSSCGLCGRLTIESLAADVGPISAPWTTTAASVVRLADRLRAAQRAFDETGGLHAAGLFSPDGGLIAFAEDVGRHNAVDKVIGRLLIEDRLPLGRAVLFVSGRTSFEIVQKALYAGVPMIASVSAPSSLAIELAEEMGITVAGFVRGQGFNLYSHRTRLEG